MTYVLKPIPDVTVDVSIQVPGEAEPSTLNARWRLHPWDEYRAKVEQLKGDQVTDERLVADDLLELTGVKGEDGKPLEHSAELVEQLMQISFVRRALVMSWFSAQEGRAASAAKN